MAFFNKKRKYGRKPNVSIGASYRIGLLLGVVCVVVSMFFLVLFPFLAYYLEQNTMGFSLKKKWIMLLGTITPAWVYLPYYLYKNGYIIFSL